MVTCAIMHKEIPLSRQNRMRFKSYPKDPPNRALCEKMIQEHEQLHPGKECLQSFGWHMCGWRGGCCEVYNRTDYDIFSADNEKFLELFTPGYSGYVACRTLPEGNTAKWFSDPVVFEVNDGNFRPTADSYPSNVMIDPGMVEDAFFRGKLTLKEWERTLGTREKESYKRVDASRKSTTAT